MTNAERLAALFRGLDRAHGLSRPFQGPVVAGRAKVEHRYETVRTPTTVADWENRLAGQAGLVPVPIRDDGSVYFGAIDVDRYPLDLGALALRAKELGLPLVTCRSKSGGAHLYLFLSEPSDAARVQEVLGAWAAVLGYPKSEIFPKQVELASENDVGNGINAPYYGANSTRYAVDKAGAALDLAQFLDLAEATRTTLADLPEVEDGLPDGLEDAPPCLQHWCRVGVPEGQRNDTMFDFAVYCRRRWPDDWQSRFEDFNRRYCDPPLPSADIVTLQKQIARKETYTYKAKCEGPYCNPRLCQKRAHGRGGGYDDDPNVVVDGLVVVLTDPPIWIVSVNGHRLELNTDQFQKQTAFGTRVLEQLRLQPRTLKAAAWKKQVDKLLSAREEVPAPPDASPGGQLEDSLHQFLDRHVASDRAKLTMGHAWVDEEAGRTWLRSPDLLTFLKLNRVTARPGEVYGLIRRLGGGDQLVTVGKKKVRAWWIPTEPTAAEEPLKVPDVRDRDEDVPF